MKIDSPRFPQLPLSPVQNKPTNQPLQGEADLEQDAEQFRQSMSDEGERVNEQPTQDTAERGQLSDLFRPPVKKEQRDSSAKAKDETRTGAGDETPAKTKDKTRTGAGDETPAKATQDAAEPGKAKTPGQSGSDAVKHPDSETKSDDTSRKQEADPVDDARIAAGRQDLNELAAMQRADSQNMAAQRAGEVAAPTISPELVSDVAQRILVSTGARGQDKEVRIQIKNTVLQDTEVIIKRDSGAVVVNFITQTPADSELLGNSQKAIASTLEQSLHSPVRVNVNADKEHADDQDRRSKGFYIEEEDM